MLSVAQIRRLAFYFNALDANLVEGLAVADPPDEDEVTRRLGQLLRERDKWYAPGPEMKEDPYLAIEVQRHPTGWENEITYSDYGLVISFEDEVLGRGAQTTAYLIQAKRLYDDDGVPPTYDLKSQFKAKNDSQRLSLRHLETHLGENTVKFASYCPRLSAFEPQSVQKVRQLHKENAGALYTGTSFGQELQRDVSDEKSTASEAGFWISPVSLRLAKAADLHRTAFLESLPFGWFLIANLWTLATVGNTPHLLERRLPPHLIPWINPDSRFEIGLNLGQSLERHKLTLGLARGDMNAAQKLANISGDRVPASRFRPKAVFEIRMTRTLVPDLRPSPDFGPDDGPRP